jgi:2,4-dienoyl-CoA reductase-like NADH-dependent reductase (Old Yellow Enzyme family)
MLEIAESIHKKLPTSTGFMVGIKLNSAEFQDGGFTSDEAKEVCQMLEDAQFDFVELSGGTYQSLAFQHKRESTKTREAFFIEFAEKITPGLNNTKSYVTGGLKTIGAMVAALKHVDGVGLARAVCQEPHCPKT